MSDDKITSGRTIRNARIKSTKLGFDRGVFLCGWLHLGWEDGGQGFGGYVLANKTKNKFAGPYAERWLVGVLDTLEVEKWEDLPGTPVRIDHDRGQIYGIGHFMKDQWFYPEEEFKEIAKREEEDA